MEVISIFLRIAMVSIREGGIAQRKHFSFSPSSPGFDSPYTQEFF